MEYVQKSGVGSVCAIGSGFLLVVIAVTYFLVPPEQAATTTFFSSTYFSSINESFITQEIIYWSLIFTAIFGIGVVAVLTDRFRDINKDLSTWTSVLAYIGFGIQILCNVLGRDYVLRIAPYYNSLEPIVQAVINFQGNLFNDWAAFGLIGFWLIAINFIIFQDYRFPKLLAVTGFFTGLGYWFVALGNILNMKMLINISAASAIVLAPLWYFRIGILFIRKPESGLNVKTK